VADGAALSLASGDTSRAFTRADREHLLTVADEHMPTAHRDVADLVHFMAGTGVRISEGLGVRWDDVDLEAGTAFIRGTKTAASTRRLSLPAWLTERLASRAERMGTDGYVFPSPGISDTTKPRDRRNVARAIRSIMDEAGLPWATPHTLRRTVATFLDEAGMPMALAANQLGNADPAMTARVYLGRKGDTSAATSVL
jgi:integrase